MGILDQNRFVERLTFFDGQRLFASDLQGIEAFHREMRELHNQSLHQPGIGNGYTVAGERDAREVRVGPGYATDALGREIVLTREQVEPVPPVAAESDGSPVSFDLAVSFDDEPETAETRQGICADRGAVRLREEPVLCFVRLTRGPNGVLQAADEALGQEIQAGLRIVLARIEVLDCKLFKGVSLAERRSARPVFQPRLACGEAEIPAGDVTPIGGSADSGFFHLKSTVDTSSAGFVTTPCYSVRLARERVGTEIDDDEVDILYYLLDGSPHVFDSQPTSFSVEVVFQAVILGTTDPGSLKDGWRAVWMGVE